MVPLSLKRAHRLRLAAGEFLPELIYGANDGIVTTFAIVSGVVGAQLSARVVLILGIASLFADGLSMATSNFLSERSRPNVRLGARAAATRSAVTFTGFVLFGAIPLAAYLVPIPGSTRFWAAGGLTLTTLFVVGASRALASEYIRWFRGGLEMLVVGAGAAGVAYAVGASVAAIVGQSPNGPH